MLSGRRAELDEEGFDMAGAEAAREAYVRQGLLEASGDAADVVRGDEVDLGDGAGRLDVELGADGLREGPGACLS